MPMGKIYKYVPKKTPTVSKNVKKYVNKAIKTERPMNYIFGDFTGTTSGTMGDVFRTPGLTWGPGFQIDRQIQLSPDDTENREHRTGNEIMLKGIRIRMQGRLENTSGPIAYRLVVLEKDYRSDVDDMLDVAGSANSSIMTNWDQWRQQGVLRVLYEKDFTLEYGSTDGDATHNQFKINKYIKINRKLQYQLGDKVADTNYSASNKQYYVLLTCDSAAGYSLYPTGYYTIFFKDLNE